MFYSDSILFSSGGRSNYRIPSIVADNHENIFSFCIDRKDTLIDHAAEKTIVCRVKRYGEDWSDT